MWNIRNAWEFIVFMLSFGSCMEVSNNGAIIHNKQSIDCHSFCSSFIFVCCCCCYIMQDSSPITTKLDREQSISAILAHNLLGFSRSCRKITATFPNKKCYTVHNSLLQYHCHYHFHNATSNLYLIWSLPISTFKSGVKLIRTTGIDIIISFAIHSSNKQKQLQLVHLHTQNCW